MGEMFKDASFALAEATYAAGDFRRENVLAGWHNMRAATRCASAPTRPASPSRLAGRTLPVWSCAAITVLMRAGVQLPVFEAVIDPANGARRIVFTLQCCIHSHFIITCFVMIFT